MIFVFYGFVAGGVALLLAELAGRLTASEQRLPPWRVLGVVAGAGPGLAPILAVLTNRLIYSGLTLPAMATAYLLAYLVFAAGVIDWRDSRPVSIWLRRIGYLGLLALVALPSFVLLLLTPLVFLAGGGLVRGPVEPDGQR